MNLSTGGVIPVYGAQGMSRKLIAATRRHAQFTGGFTDRVSQYRYNPFRQNSNLEVPTEYTTRNVYKRHFFRTNPIVGNAIKLHAEFPLSQFHLEHEDEAIQEFLNDLLEECNFLDHLLMASIEYWLIGEFNMFAFYDNYDNPSCYTGFTLLDPNKLDIVTNQWVQGPNKQICYLKFDKTTQQIVDQGPTHPVTGELYRNLPPDVIYSAKTNQALRLSPLQLSRVLDGQALSPRGESSLESIFPLLMYKDKLRAAQMAIADRHVTPVEIWKIGETGDPADQEEIAAFQEMLASQYYDISKCFHPSHECLTKTGFKHYKELTLDDEIGTLNPETGELEFQKPSEIHEYDFDGELVHFSRFYTDSLVTPNHRMWVTKRNNVSKPFWKDTWEFQRADEIHPGSRFRSVPDSWTGISLAEIPVGNFKVPISTYVKFAGYFASEGGLGITAGKLNDCFQTQISQMEYSEHFADFEECALEFSFYVPLIKSTFKSGQIAYLTYDKSVFEHFKNHYGRYCTERKLPQFLIDLPKPFLLEFLRRASNGDGTQHFSKKDGRATHDAYYSSSKILIDQLQGICLRLGFPSYSRIHTAEGTAVSVPDRRLGSKEHISKRNSYLLTWSYPIATDGKKRKGLFPRVGTNKTKDKSIKKFPYTGKVWCVTVPNGILFTRRNGTILASGNSIVWHHAVNYEACGTQGKILNLWPEFDSIDNEICAGLLINKGLIYGDTSTFASDIVRYDILINRYLLFRTRIENWMLHSVLEPLLKIHEIYVPESKVKSMNYRKMCGKGRPLSYPSIRWEKESLRDENARIQLLTTAVEKKLVPKSMLVRMLGIDPIVAQEKLEKEAEDEALRHAKLLKRLQKSGIPITPELAQILGIGQGGPMPGPDSLGSGINIDSGGGGGGGSAMGGPPGGGPSLPNVVPMDGGTPSDALPDMGLPGAPPESQQPIGTPVG